MLNGVYIYVYEDLVFPRFMRTQLFNYWHRPLYELKIMEIREAIEEAADSQALKHIQAHLSLGDPKM